MIDCFRKSENVRRFPNVTLYKTWHYIEIPSELSQNLGLSMSMYTNRKVINFPIRVVNRFKLQFVPYQFIKSSYAIGVRMRSKNSWCIL